MLLSNLQLGLYQDSKVFGANRFVFNEIPDGPKEIMSGEKGDPSPKLTMEQLKAQMETLQKELAEAKRATGLKGASTEVQGAQQNASDRVALAELTKEVRGTQPPPEKSPNRLDEPVLNADKAIDYALDVRGISFTVAKGDTEKQRKFILGGINEHINSIMNNLRQKGESPVLNYKLICKAVDGFIGRNSSDLERKTPRGSDATFKNESGYVDVSKLPKRPLTKTEYNVDPQLKITGLKGDEIGRLKDALRNCGNPEVETYKSISVGTPVKLKEEGGTYYGLTGSAGYYYEVKMTIIKANGSSEEVFGSGGTIDEARDKLLTKLSGQASRPPIAW